MQYLTVSQAAAAAGVTRSAVYQAIARGDLRQVRIADRVFVIDVDLDAWRASPGFKARGSKWMRAQKKAPASS